MKNRVEKSIPIACIISVVCIGLIGCKESVCKGTSLQKFEIINTQLDNVISGIKDSTFIKDNLADDNHVIVMVLRDFDSNLEFCFTSADKNDISRMYIYNNLRRIVGYLDHKGTDVIILSEEKHKYYFEDKFYKFLIPTKEKCNFDYIYFPDDLYVVDDKGKPFPSGLFNPYYYFFYFKEGNFVPINYNVLP